MVRGGLFQPTFTSLGGPTLYNMATQNHCLSHWSSPNVGWFWSPQHFFGRFQSWSCTLKLQRGNKKIMSPKIFSWWWLEPWNFEWLSIKKSEFHKIPTVTHSLHHFSEGSTGSTTKQYGFEAAGWPSELDPYNFNGIGLGFRSRRSVRWFDVQLTGDIFSEIHRKSALLYIISRRMDVHCFSASVVKKKEIQTDGHHDNQWLPSGKHIYKTMENHHF